MTVNLDHCIKYNIIYEGDQLTFSVSTFTLDDNLSTSLVVFGGFSHESTHKTYETMTKSKIKNYKNIINIYYPIEFKNTQKEVCKSPYTDFTKEIEMNKKFGLVMIELLTQLNLSDIHLIGKCAGCGLAIQTFVKNPTMFNKLILCVPASYNDIQDLQKVSTFLENKQFLFVWNKNDKYKFGWHNQDQESSDGCNSNEEIGKYEKTISNIPEMIMDVNTLIVITERDCHEIPATDIFEY